MRITDEFIVNEVGGEWFAVPIGKAQDRFNGLVRLNKTAKDVWEGLSEGLSVPEIVTRLTERYDQVDRQEAEAQVNQLCDRLKDAGILME